MLKKLKSKLKQNKRTILVAIVLIFLILILHFTLNVNLDSLKKAIQSQGIKGQIIYLVYTIISVPIVSLPNFPLWPIVFISYGYLPSVILTTLGVVGGSVINFWLARKYGKKFVIRLVGQKKYKEIESYLGIDDPKSFLILRLFGHNIFDIVSFVGGFSKLPFKYYLLITSSVSFVWLLIGFAIVDEIVRMPSAITGAVMVAGYLITLAMAGYVIEVAHKRKVKEAKRLARLKAKEKQS